MRYDPRNKQVKCKALLDYSWSDGDMITGKGETHPYFTEDQKNRLTFHNHKWLGGEVVVSYDNEIIFITTNGIKANFTVANEILEHIKSGYNQSPGLLED